MFDPSKENLGLKIADKYGLVHVIYLFYIRYLFVLY